LPLRLREFIGSGLHRSASLELTRWVCSRPVPQAQQQKQEAKPEKQELAKNVDVRKELSQNVDRPDLVPKEIGKKASDIPPYETTW